MKEFKEKLIEFVAYLEKETERRIEGIESLTEHQEYTKAQIIESLKGRFESSKKRADELITKVDSNEKFDEVFALEILEHHFHTTKKLFGEEEVNWTDVEIWCNYVGEVVHYVRQDVF